MNLDIIMEELNKGMSAARIDDMVLMNESLAEDVRALTYKVADLTETVEVLTRVISTES